MKHLVQKRSITLLIVTLGLFLGSGLTQSYGQEAKQEIRPGQIFLSGYSALEEAEKFEKVKLYKHAWNKYHQALRSYQSLSHNFPEWKASIVSMRIRDTKEQIKRVEPLAQIQHAEKQAKLKDYQNKNTSESGIPSVELATKGKSPTPTNPANAALTKAIAQNGVVPAREQKRMAELYDAIKQYRQHIAKLENQRKVDKELNRREVSKLTDKLRKAQQGLGGNDNTQTRILNSQIDRLQQKLGASDKRSKEQLKKMFELHNELTKKRDMLASAPLRKDVENLEREKQRYEAEIESIVAIHKKHLREFKKMSDEKDQAMANLELMKGSLAEKSKQLDASKKASHKVVTALRKTIKEQQAQIGSLEQQVVALNLQNDTLKEKLAATNSLNQELKDELAAVTLERDKLGQLLNLNDTERAKRTIKEALRLGEEVRKQQAIIKQLINDKNMTQDEVLSWQSKLAVAKQKIINLENENTDYIRRIASLENSLRNTNNKLTKSLDDPNANPMEREEAIELKKALKRLTVKLDRKKQAEEMLWKEYQKSGTQGSSLGFAIANLIQDKITLTDDEKKLLKKKQDTANFSLPGVKLKSPAERKAAMVRADAQIESLESLALGCVERGNLETAKVIYDEAYNAHGQHYPFFINRGVVRFNLNEFEDAEEIFESGTQLKEKSPYTHYMLGVCRYENQKDELAKKSLQQAINLRPDYTDAYMYLGNISYAQGNLNKAKDCYAKAVRINPEDSKAQYNLSYIHFEMGNKKQAVKFYNEALKAGLAPMLDYEKKIGINKAQ